MFPDSSLDDAIGSPGGIRFPWIERLLVRPIIWPSQPSRRRSFEMTESLDESRVVLAMSVTARQVLRSGRVPREAGRSLVGANTQ